MEVTCSVGARSETEYEHPLIQSFSAAAGVLAIWLRMLFRGHLRKLLYGCQSTVNLEPRACMRLEDHQQSARVRGECTATFQ